MLEVVQLRKAGWTYAEIGEKFGFTRGRAQQVFKQAMERIEHEQRKSIKSSEPFVD